MDHPLDKTLVAQGATRLGDGNAGFLDARRKPVEFCRVRHLPAHKGEFVAALLQNHEALAPVIHPE